MKNFLYLFWIFIVFIGCTSNENDEIGRVQTYTVNDLVEFDDIKYVRFFEMIVFYGNILYPFSKDSYELGHFTISYEGEVHPDYPSNSFVKWYF